MNLWHLSVWTLIQYSWHYYRRGKLTWKDGHEYRNNGMNSQGENNPRNGAWDVLCFGYQLRLEGSHTEGCVSKAIFRDRAFGSWLGHEGSDLINRLNLLRGTRSLRHTPKDLSYPKCYFLPLCFLATRKWASFFHLTLSAMCFYPGHCLKAMETVEHEWKVLEQWATVNVDLQYYVTVIEPNPKRELPYQDMIRDFQSPEIPDNFHYLGYQSLWQLWKPWEQIFSCNCFTDHRNGFFQLFLIHSPTS